DAREPGREAVDRERAGLRIEAQRAEVRAEVEPGRDRLGRDPRVEPGRADLDGAVGERVGALRVEAARGDLAAVRVDGAKTQPEPAQRDGRAVRGGAQRSEADC